MKQDTRKEALPRSTPKNSQIPSHSLQGYRRQRVDLRESVGGGPVRSAVLGMLPANPQSRDDKLSRRILLIHR
jgi:hypothetical protein